MSSEPPFREVRRLLESHSRASAAPTASSPRPGHNPISIPVHKDKVKPVYVRKIQQIIEAEDKGGTA